MECHLLQIPWSPSYVRALKWALIDYIYWFDWHKVYERLFPESVMRYVSTMSWYITYILCRIVYYFSIHAHAVRFVVLALCLSVCLLPCYSVSKGACTKYSDTEKVRWWSILHMWTNGTLLFELLTYYTGSTLHCTTVFSRTLLESNLVEKLTILIAVASTTRTPYWRGWRAFAWWLILLVIAKHILDLAFITVLDRHLYTFYLSDIYKPPALPPHSCQEKA